MISNAQRGGDVAMRLLTSLLAPKKKSPSPLRFLLLAMELPLSLLNPRSTSLRSMLRVLGPPFEAFFNTPSNLLRSTASCGVRGALGCW